MHPITDPILAAAAAELRARLTADLLELTATLPDPAYLPERRLHHHSGDGVP